MKIKPVPSEYVRINLSQPLMGMGRCRFCGSPPTVYYFVGRYIRWDSPDAIRNMFARYIRRVKRLCANYYLMDDPKSFTGIGFLSYSTRFKTYQPTIHHNRIPTDNKEEPEEFLTCKQYCGATVWAFNEKQRANRLEIIHRKGRYKYPRKIHGWDFY